MERRPLVLINGRVCELPNGDTLPAGGEENMQYAKKTDFVGDNIIYTGEAAVGSLGSAAVWRIFKLTFVGDDVEKTWADGDANFDNVWENRASLIYS